MITNKFDEDFKNLRRTAIVIKPKKPFFDWVKFLNPLMKEEDWMKEGNIYLLPDYETVEEMEKWLKRFYTELFEEELNNWYVDEEVWPQNRSFKEFSDWFSYECYTMIFDTQKGFIEKL